MLGSAGMYLNSCGAGNDKTNAKTIGTKDSITKDTISAKSLESKVEPTYKLYKKGDEQYETLRKGFNKRNQQASRCDCCMHKY